MHLPDFMNEDIVESYSKNVGSQSLVGRFKIFLPGKEMCLLPKCRLNREFRVDTMLKSNIESLDNLQSIM